MARYVSRIVAGMKPRTRKRLWLTVGVLLGVPLLLSTISRIGSSRVTISPETTCIEGPLTEDGYPDYVAALNARLSEGVTAENNALALLWQAFGPTRVKAEHRERFFGALGIDVPPEDGDYLVDIEDVENEATQKRGELFAADQLSEAGKRAWSSDEFPAVAAWLDRIDGPLGLIVDASRRSRYFRPLVPDGEPPAATSVTPSFPALRDCAYALTARAMLKVGQGDVRAAMDDLLACHRLGRLAAEGPTLLEGLVGLAIVGIVCDADVGLAQSGQAGTAQLREYALRLRSLPTLPEFARHLDVGERYMFLDSVVALARGTWRSPDDGVAVRAVTAGALRWDEVLRTINEWFDRLLETQRQPTCAARRDAVAALLADLKSVGIRARSVRASIGAFFAKAARTRLVADRIVALLLPTSASVVDQREIAHMHIALVQVAIALAAYRNERGSYPETIQQLKSEYLDELPQDIFSEAPLRYRRDGTGYVLYSVGRDGEDDGGTDSLQDIVVATPDPSSND